MIGENFKRVNRSTIKDLQSKIQDLKNQCGELVRIAKRTEDGLPDKYWELSKEIEWQEYLLWGARQGILR
jgi:hypothetical protein